MGFCEVSLYQAELKLIKAIIAVTLFSSCKEVSAVIPIPDGPPPAEILLWQNNDASKWSKREELSCADNRWSCVKFDDGLIGHRFNATGGGTACSYGNNGNGSPSDMGVCASPSGGDGGTSANAVCIIDLMGSKLDLNSLRAHNNVPQEYIVEFIFRHDYRLEGKLIGASFVEQKGILRLEYTVGNTMLSREWVFQGKVDVSSPISVRIPLDSNWKSLDTIAFKYLAACNGAAGQDGTWIVDKLRLIARSP